MISKGPHAQRRISRRSHRALRGIATGLLAVSIALSMGATASGASGTARGSRHLSVNPSLRKLLPASVRSSGKVRVASDMPFPPYEYTVNGHLTGFEYELAQEMGTLLGVKFVFMQQPLAGIIPGFTAGKYDASMSDMADIPSREKAVYMVDEFRAVGGWLVQKGNPLHIKVSSDLCGKTLSVSQGGYSQELVGVVNTMCKQEKKPLAKALTYSTQSSTYLAVKSGKAATTVNDAGALGYLARTVDNGKAYSVVIFPKPVGPVVDGAIGVSKAPADKGLAQAIKQALQYLINHGDYGALTHKYHIEFSALKTVTIDGKP